MGKIVTPKPRTYTENDLLVYNGLQFRPEDVPEHVDAKSLPTLREWMDAHRVGGKQAAKASNKSATAAAAKAKADNDDADGE